VTDSAGASVASWITPG
jgi:hypothetical protein